ncbi:hypothetical protein Tco_0481478 [Tanacetum coccineum]
MDTFLTFSNVRSQVNLWWSQAGKANMKNAMQTGMGHNERNANDQNEEAEIRIGEHIFQACKKESFRYLGSMIHKSGRIEDDGGDWPLTKVQANRMEVAKLRMLRWTCGKTILDMIPNGAFRRNLQVATIVNKMREGRLRWFGHVKKRPRSVRRVESITVDGVRRSSRPKLMWEDRLKTDLKVVV